MADINLGNVFEPYVRDGHLFFRTRHDTERSMRAKRFRSCVSGKLRGHTYRGHGAAEDEREARAALAIAARECSKAT